MKIDSSLSAPASLGQEVKKTGEPPARPTPPDPGAARPEESGPTDVVRLSERSRLAARATELAHAAPEVRQDKVDGLKSQIGAGAYNVSGRVVAEALIRKSITEV